MDPGELLRFVTSALNRIGVDHFVTGSTATIAYGEPRLTNDIDIVVRLDDSTIEALCRVLAGDDFYLAKEAVERAVRDSSSFNLIHPGSGLKVDFMVADDSAFNCSRFDRATELQIADGERARFATPEDVILKKLEYYRDGKSEKHLRDIAGVLRVSGDEIDFGYIREWVRVLGLDREWDLHREDLANRRRTATPAASGEGT